MDAILVFDPNNYLIHCSHNRPFLDEIVRTALDNKQLPVTGASAARRYLHQNNQEFRSLVVLLLGPFVASIKVLQSDCPRIDLFGTKSSNVRIFYYEYLDFMFVYLCDVSNGFNGKLMQRKLEIFVELCKFLFGANLQQMDKDSKQSRLLHLLFQNWQQQRHRPMFLLESVERLAINPTLHHVFKYLLQELTQKLTNFLEPISEEIPCESFLFINDKLLCSHQIDDAPTVLKSDFLLISLLVNTFFQCYSDNKQLFKISTSDDEMEEELKKEEKSKTIETSEKSELTSDSKTYPKIEVDRSYVKEAIRQHQNPKNIQDQNHNNILHFISMRDKYLFDDCEQRLVFLHSYLEPNNLVPFYVRFIRLSEELCFVCLSELPSTFLTYHVHNLLGIINSVQYHPHELRCFHTLKQLENSTQKLQLYVQRLLSRNSDSVDSNRRQQLCRTLLTRMSSLTSSPLKKHILSFEMKPLTSQLEAVCSSVSRCLRDTLEHLVYSYHQQRLQDMDYDVIDYLSEMKLDLLHQIKDYNEFLLVKSKRNVAIEPYLPFIQKLVCFLFVDRSVNEFIFASAEEDENQNTFAQNDFNHTSDKHRTSLDYNSDCELDFYSNMISQVITKSYVSLASGELYCRWSENGYLYNYCIWFEDHAGNVLDYGRKSIKLNSFPNLTTSNFVQRIAAHCFPCYRLQQNMRNEPRSNGSQLTQGIRKMLNPEVHCFELFYVQQLDNNAGNCLNYINNLRNEKLNSQRYGSLLDSNIAISKRFANKLKDILNYSARG